MARIFPFTPYRYSPKAGNIADLATEPYDRITPELQAQYLARSPYNLVRVILGERFESDTEADNVYVRAAGYLQEWIDLGILAKDPLPGFYPYFQSFTVPFSGEKLTRKGFIGLGALEAHEAGVVFRHERTLAAPKKDRRALLDHTRAHFGQIFMLYPDQEGAIDLLLDQVSLQQKPLFQFTDQFGTEHTLYALTDPQQVEFIQHHLSNKKLLIADGHHRYETALSYQRDHPELEDAGRVMMTFVNLHSPGLRNLAAHRVIHGLPAFDRDAFLARVQANFRAVRLDSIAALQRTFEQPDPENVRIAAAFGNSTEVYLFERPREGAVDVRILTDLVMGEALGISAEDVQQERYIHYVRGLEPAARMAQSGEAQIAFLLEPATVQQVAETAFAGGVMPQKSTDFYPKMLSGLTIYKLEK